MLLGLKKMDKGSKIRAYIYPVTNRLRTGVYNPYIDNFMNSTDEFVEFMNKEYPSDTGFLNIVKFISGVDVLFLNWIEDLPDKKGGLIQTVFFLFILKLKKIFRIKVIWTLHNKITHTSNNQRLKKFIFSALLKRSDMIITHSREGISFAETYMKSASSKVFYFPHPVVPKDNHQAKDKKYDILIWGTISPYKHVDSFLDYLRDNDLLDRYSIMIAGKITDSVLSKKIKQYERENITIQNRFISNEELTQLINISSVVLFTYSADTVLSSGALMDSIAHKCLVAGPGTGAFADLGEMGIIEIYNNFHELTEILEKTRNIDMKALSNKIEDFINSHTWIDFSKSLASRIMALK